MYINNTYTECSPRMTCIACSSRIIIFCILHVRFVMFGINSNLNDICSIE